MQLIKVDYQRQHDNGEDCLPLEVHNRFLSLHAGVAQGHPAQRYITP